MSKITPHLWFDKEAREATEFYTAAFRDSRVRNITTIGGTPSGNVDIVDIEIFGQSFTLLSAGPDFKFTPAISFLVLCDDKDEVDAMWEHFSKGGVAFMELGAYPFSERYCWIQDRYGLSWQFIYMKDSKLKQKITPTLMFSDSVCGKAEEAIKFYTSVFKNTKIGDSMRYTKEDAPDVEGTIKHAEFTLEGQNFAAMDSARSHNFPFNEAISFIVSCKDQEELDYYWNKLSADPEAEQCGWLKDKYGVSWQIVPAMMGDMMASKDSKKLQRVTDAFLKMKKFDIAELEKAYNG